MACVQDSESSAPKESGRGVESVCDRSLPFALLLKALFQRL